MLAPPHPMVPGTTDTDYYAGKITGAVPVQLIEQELLDEEASEVTS
jgi:hypothetical protein